MTRCEAEEGAAPFVLQVSLLASNRLFVRRVIRPSLACGPAVAPSAAMPSPCSPDHTCRGTCSERPRTEQKRETRREASASASVRHQSRNASSLHRLLSVVPFSLCSDAWRGRRARVRRDRLESASDTRRRESEQCAHRTVDCDANVWIDSFSPAYSSCFLLTLARPKSIRTWHGARDKQRRM